MRPSAVITVLAVAIAASPAGAQLVGGQAVDAADRAPLGRLPVFLLRDSGGKTATVTDLQTDAKGYFQIMVPRPGTYRVAFGDTTRPISVGPRDSLHSDTAILRLFLVPLSTHSFEYNEVDLTSEPLPGGRKPRYPPELLRRRVEGEVVVGMVIDATGRVDTTTFEVKFTSAPEFAESVRAIIPTLRFVPARWRGFNVREVRSMPFNFMIPREVRRRVPIDSIR